MMPTIGLTLAFGSASCVLYALATGNIATLLGAALLAGGGGGLGSVLQARLMDVARDAQTLAAALDHSAFNKHRSAALRQRLDRCGAADERAGDLERVTVARPAPGNHFSLLRGSD